MKPVDLQAFSDYCLLLSQPFLYSQKGSKDGKRIEAIKRTHPVQKYEVRIHFYTYILPYLVHMPDDRTFLVIAGIMNTYYIFVVHYIATAL